MLEGEAEPGEQGVNYGQRTAQGSPQVADKSLKRLERANGFEPSTCTLARYRSTN